MKIKTKKDYVESLRKQPLNVYFMGEKVSERSTFPAFLPHIKVNMDLCNRKWISKVVRFIPDPEKDIGFNILSLFHYRRGIPIVTCESLKEAASILAS